MATSFNDLTVFSDGTRKSLFEFVNNLDEGFELLELLLDKQGTVVDFVFLMVNSAFEKQTGLKTSDIIGKRKKEIAPASDQKWYDYAIQAVKSQQKIQYHYYNAKVNRHFETQFIPISTIQVAVLFKEITEQKQTEENLLFSESRFKQLVENAPDMIYTSDLNGNFLDANRQTEKILGYPKEELIGQSIQSFFSESDAYKIMNDLAEGLRGKKTGPKEYQLKTRTAYVPVEISTFPVKVGNHFEIVGIARDLTERKKTEIALRESEERLKVYLESTPTAVFVADPDGKYLYVNGSSTRLLGYSKKELLSMSIPQVICEGFLDIGLAEFREVKETGRSRSEMCLKRKNGTPVYVILTATKLPDGNLMANCEDLTERKELEKQLQDKERLAAIGTTAGMVGHDIRNPLQAMISDVYLLKDYLTNMPPSTAKDDVAESLVGIEKNIIYVNKIVSDLQDYARKSEPTYVEVNLYDLVKSVFQPIEMADNIKCSIEIEPSLQVKTDPELITRMLTNLITNALQAMPDGGKLTVKGYTEKGKVYLIVEDTGVGIPKEVQPKLFTPMMTTKAKGQGLGLAVVKRLVEALGGKISFESQEGKGTEFIIELPV